MLALEFIDSLGGASSADEAAAVLVEKVRPFGFTCVAMAELPEIGVKPPLVAQGWPPGWVVRFLGNGLDRSDSVLRAARNRTDAFMWSEVPTTPQPIRAARDLKRSARAHGISDGLAVPVIGYDGSQWLVLIGGQPGIVSQELRNQLQLACVYSLHCARERNSLARRGLRRPSTEAVVAVHVVRLENAWFYERELAEARQLFASDGWSRGPLSGSSQIQDTADVDLLAIERGSNRVVGWAQLEATIGAERGEASPSLAGRLRSPAVFRISGFGILGGREGQRLSRAAAALLAGLQEFGLKANLEQLTLEANMLDLPALLDLGWNPDPLAPVLCSGAATTVPLTVDISEAALRRTRRLLGIVGPVVVRRKMRRVPASHTTSGSRIYH